MSNMKTSEGFYVSCCILCCFLCFSHSLDTLRPGKILRSNETLTSSVGIFELGFFTSSKSGLQYLGIWFKNDINKKPVWVANRVKPLGYATGSLRIWYDGNLVLNDARTSPIILSDGADATSNETIAKLLDSGNLVLMEGQKTIWQSFDYPTDTFLPGMNLGWFDLDTDYPRNLLLSSWSSPSDPSPGIYYLGLDENDKTKFTVWRSRGAYQQIGFWDGHVFRFFFQSSLDNHQNFSFVSNSKDVYLTFKNKESSIISWFILASGGSIYEFRMAGDQDISSVNYSLCDAKLPQSSTGCLELMPSTCKDGDDFSEIKGLIPNSTVVTWEGNMDGSNCELICRSNCSCVAYAAFADDGSGCKLLYGNKADLLKNKGGGNNTIYVRVGASNSDLEGWKLLLIIIIVVTPLALILLTMFLYRLRRRFNSSGSGGRPGGTEEAQLGTENDPSRADIVALSTTRDYELPLLSFPSVVAATNGFSFQNKLGEGGFGPVYKGKLHGHDIAVKRLSKYSGQGSVEFKNEVQLISKLQHRNLVKLLGCCVEQEEKILIYEYMANKSLDSFIFDAIKQPLLDWRKRKHIIEGIAQGLLYLHMYSRVRIVHRDLKTSNILLDNYMNPKISDFGMARILFENESQQPETKKIAGTCGYMSPEYAVHGFYSTKSDVFSFGVIVLEIASGRKNATFHEPTRSLNLLGYAWELWNGERWMELMDPTLDNSSLYEMKLCVQVGLLCVQENAEDRPTMSDVVSIFSNERVSLPSPKQPAYSTILNAGDGSTSRKQSSQNLASVSLLQAR